MVHSPKLVWFILAAWLGFSVQLSAQDVQVLSATQERWTNGACCGGGVRYEIVLKVDFRVRDFQIDSVWSYGSNWGDLNAIARTVRVRKTDHFVVYTLQRVFGWNQASRELSVDLEAEPLVVDAGEVLPGVIQYRAGGKVARLEILAVRDLVVKPRP